MLVFRQTTACRAFLLLAGAWAAGTTYGDVLFSDLGSGSTPYSPAGYGFFITGLLSGEIPAGYSEGFAFVPSETGTVTQIDVGIQSWSGNGSGSAELTLAADAAGLPGTPLDTWSLTNLPGLGTPCCALDTVTPHLPVQLIAGTQYWLIASPLDPYTDDVWFGNNTRVTGITAFSPTGGPFSLRAIGPPGDFGAFDLIGVASTPEPSTVFLLLTCLPLTLAMWLRRTRRRRILNS